MIVLLSLAFAQVPDEPPAIDAQMFRPTAAAQRTLWTLDTTKLPSRYWTVGLVGHYARDPLVWHGTDGSRTAVVSDVVTSSLMGGVQLGPLWLGGDVPFILRSTGSAGGETGLGDVAVDGRVTLTQRANAPVGTALFAQARLPTSTVSTSLGSSGVAYEAGVAVDREVGPALLVFNGGFHGSPGAQLESREWRGRVFARLGAGLEVSDKVELSGELVGAKNLGALAAGAGLPLEAMAGASYRFVPTFEARAGIGTGLTGAIGAPVARGLLTVAYAPPLQRDSDSDGITDDLDKCRSVPEDRDGVEDADGCPDPTRVTIRVEDRQGHLIGPATWELTGEEPAYGVSGDSLERSPGSYTLSARAEGYKSGEVQRNIRDGGPQDLVVVLERIVQLGTVAVTIEDEDGGPVDEARWWVVGDRKNKHPTSTSVELEPGGYKVRIEAPGFRPQTLAFDLAEGGEQAVAVRLQTARVVLGTQQITIKDSIYFETGKATIKPESFDLLNEVAQVMADHPELLKIRIEGHTDSRGSAFANKKLSTDRAQSVVDFLVEAGIERDRLDPIGFGEERPLVPEDNEAAWSKNRRVDFFIVDREEP